MKKKDFEKKLKETFHEAQPMVKSKSLENTFFLVREEIHKRHKRNSISFMRFLSKQIKFMGWKIWAVQGAFLLGVVCVLARIYGGYFFENPQSIPKLLFCLAVSITMNSLPILYRSVRYQMQEVEAATYFSSVKLLAAKLLLVGMGDLFLLTGILVITVAKTSLQANNAVLYLVFPFLFVSSGCLFMLGHFTSKIFLGGSIGLCSLMILVCVVIPRYFESLFQQSFSIGWMVVCGIMIGFCIQQFHYILYRSSYTEMQIVS